MSTQPVFLCSFIECWGDEANQFHSYGAYARMVETRLNTIQRYVVNDQGKYVSGVDSIVASDIEDEEQTWLYREEACEYAFKCYVVSEDHAARQQAQILLDKLAVTVMGRIGDNERSPEEKASNIISWVFNRLFPDSKQVSMFDGADIYPLIKLDNVEDISCLTEEIETTVLAYELSK